MAHCDSKEPTNIGATSFPKCRSCIVSSGTSQNGPTIIDISDDAIFRHPSPLVPCNVVGCIEEQKNRGKTKKYESAKYNYK